MARVFITALLVLCSLFYLSFYQATHIHSEEEWKDGWIDDNTYQFVATGTCRPGSKMAETLACEAALLTAQMKAIEKLADAGCRLVTGKVNIKRYKNAMVKEVSGTIRGGSILKKKFNPETCKCTIIYTISEKGLKQKVKIAAQKYVEK